MPSPQIVCERYNLALVQGLLLLAQEVEVRVREHVRAVVRLAKLRRLMCTVSEDDRGTAIELFGPLSLFRPTMKYGPSLATFFPQVVSTREWSLRARCWLSGAFASLFVSSSDPLHRAYALPQDYDSELERRLARDLRRAHPRQWTLVRESAAVRTRNGLVFPDFSLERDEHRVHVEVVGFWTPEYLARKQSELSSVVDPVMVVCVDESLGAPEGSFGRHEVVPFKRKVDAKALVAAAERVVARWTATSAR
jgi:predicted nuclease of restriction endonuclease-like RecB superfamily